MSKFKYLFARGANPGITNNKEINMLDHDRYLDGGPFAFSNNLPFPNKLESSQTENSNILERYYSSDLLDSLGDYRELFVNVAKLISNTELVQNETASEVAEHDNLYLKSENNQASQSFKDRGTLSAVILLGLIRGFENGFSLGTVSLGNMGISTPYVVDLLRKEGLNNLSSFAVVDSKMQKVRLDAMLKSAPEFGTTVFNVDGEYSNFHEKTYAACRRLRNSGEGVYAQLTDDIFRISGYCTLFWELLEQTKSQGFTPDFVTVPSCSGALARAGEYAFEQAVVWGLISREKIPGIVIIQESGADPIFQAYTKSKTICERINITEPIVAAAISASNARSGTACLELLKSRNNYCVSCNKQEILTDFEELSNAGLTYETGSTTAVTAVKELKKLGVIQPQHKVVSILTGFDEPYRDLMNNQVHKDTKIINTSEETLEDTIFNTFANNFNF